MSSVSSSFFVLLCFLSLAIFILFPIVSDAWEVSAADATGMLKLGSVVPEMIGTVIKNIALGN